MTDIARSLSLDAEVVAALEVAIPQYLARESFPDFCQLVDPEWIYARHLRYLCVQLERLERGEIDRLIIVLPPRHGKSRTAVQLFVSWFLGRRRGKCQIVIATGSSQLAEQHSRIAIDLISGNERYPFRDFSLTSTAADLWSTSTGGVVRAVGVGSQLTGFGADLLVLDDLVKDASEAYSPLVQQAHAHWLATTAFTRLMPHGKVIAIGTRWSENDALGQILNGSDADRWVQVVLPAVALEDDPLGREPGEALWPDRYPLESYPTSLSTAQFQSLYQGSPIPEGGGLFQRDWFEGRFTAVPMMSPAPAATDTSFHRVVVNPAPYVQRPTISVQAIDTASKTHSGADWTVITTFACDYAHYYLVDVRRERVEFPDLVRMILDEYEKHRPTHGVFIEEAGPSGIAISQELKRQTLLPIIPVRPEGNKVARASAITAVVEAKKVLLPERAPWLRGFLDEICSFPAARHDDQVDSFTLGLASIRDAAIRVKMQAQYDQRMSRLSAGWMSR